MADTAAKGKNRQEIDASVEYLTEKDAGLFLFKHIGDAVEGTVLGARREVTEIEGKVKRNPKGQEKRHLQVWVRDPNGDEWIVNVQSQNQKEALRKACENAGIRGLATGDFFRMEYTHDDAPLREGLTGAFGYACTVSLP